ncbi:MAG: hypothetical protein SGARI_005587 [Bacillariaceae sp.]
MTAVPGAPSVFTFDGVDEEDDEEAGQVEEEDEEIARLRQDVTGLSTEDWEAMMQEDNSDYKWTKVENVHQARFTLGVGVDESWSAAKREFEYFRDQMETKTGSRRPSLPTIVDFLFGENSPIFLEFKHEGIFDNNGPFKKFVATLLMSCVYQVSTKQLFSKYSRINLQGLMSKQEYVACWRKIGNASLPSELERNKCSTPSGMVPFWLKLETAFNTYSRELFLHNAPLPMTITTDDDKAKVDNRKYHAGLKTVRHISQF